MKYLLTCLAVLLSISQVCVSAQNISIRTVAIDAGHGGHDPGAVSRDRKTYEKTLTLDIAKRLSVKISDAYPDVRVILTRTRDEFVSLNDRAAIANRKNADLFISIHINSTASSQPNGYSIHVLGESSNKNRDLFAYNLDVCRLENSVILLEEDYSTKYQGFDPTDPESFIFMQLMQNSHLEQSLDLAQIMAGELEKGPVKANRGVWQNPFYVLWKTSMPAVLVEMGFISNSNDLQAMRSPENRDMMAEALFRSFCTYKSKYDGSIGPDPEYGSPETVPARQTDPAGTSVSKAETKPVSEAVFYGTQVFASSALLDRNDPRFMGYTPKIIHSGNIYKYVIGVSSDMSEAIRMFKVIVGNYPSAFSVEIVGNTTKIIKFPDIKQ